MEQEVKNNDSNEIDLLELLQKIFNAIGRGIMWVIYLIIRKSIWIFAFALLGIALAVFLEMTNKPFYSSMMIGRINVLDNSIIANSFPDITQTNKNDLATLFRMPDSVAKKVRAIEVFYGIDKNRDGIVDYIDYDKKGTDSKDTIPKIVRSDFYLRIQVLDVAVFPVVEKSVIEYLLNNPYILKSDTIRRQKLQQNITEINVQLARLDSLQKAEYSSKLKESALKLSNGVMLLGEKDRQLFHEDILALFEKRNEYQEELDLYQGPITIIQEFHPLLEEKKPVMHYMKITVPLFMLLGLLCAIVWQYRKSIQRLIMVRQY